MLKDLSNSLKQNISPENDQVSKTQRDTRTVQLRVPRLFKVNGKFSVFFYD